MRAASIGWVPDMALHAGAVALWLLAAPIDARGQDPGRACPLAEDSGLPDQRSQTAVRRLRDAVPPGPEHASVASDLAELAFVASTRPNPAIEAIAQESLDGERTRLRVTVRNNSRHASPDGGITLSFPQLGLPQDRDRVERVEVPEDMALHLIPAGGTLFGRNGLEQVAEHLMIEVHGAWGPRNVRTLELDVRHEGSPLVVQYRSALSDESGEYHNVPTESDVPDQQGWPTLACTIGGRPAGASDGERRTVAIGETQDAH